MGVQWSYIFLFYRSSSQNCRLSCNWLSVFNTIMQKIEQIHKRQDTMQQKQLNQWRIYVMCTSRFKRIFCLFNFFIIRGSGRREQVKLVKCTNLDRQQRYSWYYNKWCFNYTLSAPKNLPLNSVKMIKSYYHWKIWRQIVMKMLALQKRIRDV